MTKYIKEYERIIKERLGKRVSPEKLSEWIDYHKNQITHLQDERIIHLLITLNFGICFLLAVLAYLILQQFILIVLGCLFFVLLVPYIFHYYFLENTTQRWYGYEKKLYDKKSALKKN